MFKVYSEARPVEIFHGVIRLSLSNSERAMLTEIRAPKGSGASMHSHTQDEIGYVSSGRLRVRIGGKTQDMNPGDSYCVPGGEAHDLEALEDCVCVVVFAPNRPEYLY